MNKARFKRMVLLVHRWGGIGGCVLMLLWLVSGLVMLFVGYPKLLPSERMGALVALDKTSCCVPVERALQHSRAPAVVQQIRLTSVAGRPRYVMREGSGDLLAVDAATGQRVVRTDAHSALASAQAFLPGAVARVEGQVVDDRWTHSGALDAHRPLFRVQMDDTQATVLYVSSSTGEVVLDAPLAQRGWNFVGAWLHWLYMFRDGARDAVWSWTVIMLSAAGTVLAVTGALAGVWRWRFSGRYKTGARTPYREFHMRWHHLTGLVFGLVLIAWVFSGLMSMNPLGIFDPQGPRPDLAAYRQGVPGSVRVPQTSAQALNALQSQGFRAREIEWRVLAGKPYLLATDGVGSTRLLVPDDNGALAVMQRWPAQALSSAGAGLFHAPLRDARWLQAHDAFYYQRGAASMYGASERRLPVLQMVFADAGSTSVYLDPFTGDLALSVDRSQRLGRWLFNLLHSWDLPPMLRFSVARDVVLILMGLGGTAIALTGCVIGYRRLRRQAHRG